MTIKYEPVFGDQSLFDGAPEDVVIAIKDVLSTKKVYYFSKNGWIKNNNGRRLDCDVHQIAMRRIIKTPTWTWEDKKAGRLPPVGAKCLWVDKSGVPGDTHAVYPKEGTEVEIIAHYTNIKTIVVFIWVDEDGDTFNSCSCEVSDFAPYETPEEKAQRLRDEWCSECTSKYYPRGHKGFPEMIYDALLSGELKAPTND